MKTRLCSGHVSAIRFVAFLEMDPPDICVTFKPAVPFLLFNVFDGLNI